MTRNPLGCCDKAFLEQADFRYLNQSRIESEVPHQKCARAAAAAYSPTAGWPRTDKARCSNQKPCCLSLFRWVCSRVACGKHPKPSASAQHSAYRAQLAPRALRLPPSENTTVPPLLLCRAPMHKRTRTRGCSQRQGASRQRICANGRTRTSRHRSATGRTDAQAHRPIDRSIDRPTDGRINGRTDRWTLRLPLFLCPKSPPEQRDDVWKLLRQVGAPSSTSESQRTRSATRTHARTHDRPRT